MDEVVVLGLPNRHEPCSKLQICCDDWQLDHEQQRQQQNTRNTASGVAAVTATISKSSCNSNINPYHVLNVRSDALQEEIVTAYRKLALLHHPNRNTTHTHVKNNHSSEEEARLLFIIISASYETLTNKDTRQRYDMEFQISTPERLLSSQYKQQQSNNDNTQQHKQQQLYYDGPLRDLYRARQCTPFTNPHDLFDRVFQCQMFTKTKQHQQQQQSTLSSFAETPPLIKPRASPTSSISSPSSTKQQQQDDDSVDDYGFFSSFFPMNQRLLCCCNTNNSDTSTTMIGPLMARPTTTSTYLFCPEYYKCYRWIGTSKLLTFQNNVTKHVCQISKIFPTNDKIITKTEITTCIGKGSYQTHISVITTLSSKKNIAAATVSEDLPKLVLDCITPATTSTGIRRRNKHVARNNRIE